MKKYNKMKKILLILLLIWIPLKGISQTTNIPLSDNQLKEVYKGLIQGQNLKTTVSLLQKDITELEKAVNLGKSVEDNLKKEIDQLNDIIKGKNDFIQNQIRQNEIEQAKLKNKNNKSFGIGLVGGYGITINNTSSLQPFLGVGVSYNLFKF